MQGARDLCFSARKTELDRGVIVDRGNRALHANESVLLFANIANRPGSPISFGPSTFYFENSVRIAQCPDVYGRYKNCDNSTKLLFARVHDVNIGIKIFFFSYCELSLHDQ